MTNGLYSNPSSHLLLNIFTPKKESKSTETGKPKFMMASKSMEKPLPVHVCKPQSMRDCAGDIKPSTLAL